MAIADPQAGWRRSLHALLLTAYLMAMPIQIMWGATRQLAPADLFIVAYLVVRLPRLRHVPAAWTNWLLAMVPLFGFGMLVAIVKTGEITSYALLQKGVGLLVLLATFACFVDFMRDWERILWVLRVFAAAVLLHAAVALAAQVLVYVGGPTLPLINQPWPGDRISGLLLDANAFGGLTGLALLLHHLTVGTPSAVLRGHLAWIGYLVLPLTLLLTFSRSSWIGFTTGLLVVTLVRPRIGGRALLWVVAPVAVVVPLLLTQIPNSLALVTRPSEISSRVSIGEDAFREFLENPVFGMGLGAYIDEYGIVVHNTALWFLSDLGGIGLAVFVGFALSYGVKLLVAQRTVPVEHHRLLLALLGGHALMCGLSFGIEAFYQRHWWLLLAVAGACFDMARTRSSPVPVLRDDAVVR
ncbi:O-antigen ligase family protein [Pseudonocardia sp. KRD-182]|uniref:O-antigen ligase family protein n=1 Tax=Pseudonocardia oceani TaxID=2792013 RepID=UPI001C4A5998|nr:O-antigen ligase family protein [Pseudonocardia oceani]MBW0110416.1 O-antigen ligase family protein [Pseudonocardia oceani]